MTDRLIFRIFFLVCSGSLVGNALVSGTKLKQMQKK